MSECVMHLLYWRVTPLATSNIFFVTSRQALANQYVQMHHTPDGSMRWLYGEHGQVIHCNKGIDVPCGGSRQQSPAGLRMLL